MQNLELLKDAIVNDYAQFLTQSKFAEDRAPELLQGFAENIEFSEGRKYIKVLTKRSAWGFIVKGEDKKFNVGDILMAAGYNAPARNKARGNVLDVDFSRVQWTGPAYL